MDTSVAVAIALTLVVLVGAGITRIRNPGWTRSHPIAFVVLTALGIQAAVTLAVSIDGLSDFDPELWSGWLRATIAGAAFFWIVRSLGVLTDPPTVVLGFSGPEQDHSGTGSIRHRYEVAGSVTVGRGLITGVSIDMTLEGPSEGQEIRFERLRRHDLFPVDVSTAGESPTALAIRYDHAAWHPGHEPGTFGHLYYETGTSPAVVAWRVRGHGWETRGKVRLAD